MKRFILGFLVVIVAMVFMGCPNPIGSHGSLTISIVDGVSRTLVPAVSMNPDSYDIEGSGPNGSAFNETITGASSVTVDKLAFGSWTVTVTARNAGGTAIGAGVGTVTVHTNATSSLSVTVRPYDGFGSLNLSLSWTAGQVDIPQVESSLLPTTGEPRTLAFEVNASAGSASFSAGDVATGYYTLILKLKDNGYLCMGAVDVVRIVKDQTTEGGYTFSNINQGTGTLAVSIIPEMADPLDVSIGGAGATKPQNHSLALSAAVSNYSGNVSFVWYVNGDAVGTGSTYNFSESWAQGYYRIDVTAFSADGKRAGSATTQIQVVQAIQDALITHNLQIHLDSANQASYPGSGDTWYDLSGNGNDFSLGEFVGPDENDPVFSNGSFDVSNRFFTKKGTNGSFINSIHKPGARFTIEIWSYVPVGGSYFIVLGTTNNSGVTGFRWFLDGFLGGFHVIDQDNRISFYTPFTNLIPYNIRSAWQQTAISIDVVAGTGFTIRNGVIFPDVNGTFSIPTWGMSMTDAPNLLRLATQTNNEAARWPPGSRYAIIRMYDRALTLEELQSNFNHDRSRFGL